MPLKSELFWRGRDRYNFSVLAAFMLLLLFFGGASRVDVFGQGVVRIAAVLLLASSAMQIDRESWRGIKVPAIFLALWMAIIALQLVPLPPDLWASLPGRDVYGASLAAVGADQGWRPASLVPDRTLNALLAVLPPAAVALTCALLPRRGQPTVLTMLLVAIAFSTFLGVLQVASGGPYLYAVTNDGSAVGSFANRNHAALFLALSLPLLAAWVSVVDREHPRSAIRTWVALSTAVAVFPVLLVMGSRGGLLLGGLGAAAALVIESGAKGQRASRRRLLFLVGALLAAAAAVAVFVLFSRAEAFQRLFGHDGPELRSDLLPILLGMIGDYFPVGSGFGSFEYVYRMYEPQAFLGPTYLNQAHNDAVQIMIEAGLPGILLVVAFAAWLAWRAFFAWRAQGGPGVVLARTASVALAMIAIGSTFDYPLRTPLMAVTAAIMIVWLAAKPEDRTAASSAPGSLGKTPRLG